jgi:mono/diheme cytochrome c family protein
MRLSRSLLLALLAIVLVGVAAVAAVSLHIPNPQLAAALAQRVPDRANGAYVARLGDCVACHSTPGGKEFAGGLAFPTPLGSIYSSNITFDGETGIGHYSLEDFIRLMRFGVTPDGTRLYPAMPYTAFAKTSDEDLQDLYAYFKEDVPKVSAPNRSTDIVWPLSMRWPLAFWNIAFHDDSRFQPVAGQSEAWNRGAYIVQGFAHCGTCHTPRGVAMQEKDVSGRSDLFLSGSTLDGSSPINLRGNVGFGLGGWKEQDLVDVLKTGRSAFAAVHGPMTEVVEHSTKYMKDADLAAIATYVKSLSPAPNPDGIGFKADEATYRGYMAGERHDTGARIFMDSCAQCHRLSGRGEAFAFPNLTGNPSVLAANADSLIAIILRGNRLPASPTAPTALAMPAFGWRYNDDELAELTTFMRTNWGNKAPAVKPGDVANVRRQLQLEDAKR